MRSVSSGVSSMPLVLRFNERSPIAFPWPSMRRSSSGSRRGSPQKENHTSVAGAIAAIWAAQRCQSSNGITPFGRRICG
jgi:hypothetical protein